MKVYVVKWINAEPYSGYSGVHKIFYNRAQAERYLHEEGTGPHSDYYLSKNIEEYEVE